MYTGTEKNPTLLLNPVVLDATDQQQIQVPTSTGTAGSGNSSTDFNTLGCKVQ